MAIDLPTLKVTIEQGIPFIKKVGVKIEEMEPYRVHLSFPFDPTNLNHIGIVHAGALFTFGETCGGAAMGATFDLTRYRLVAKGARIDFLKAVRGEIWGAAQISPEAAASVAEEIEKSGKAIFPLVVSMWNPEEKVAEMTIDYHLSKIPQA